MSLKLFMSCFLIDLVSFVRGSCSGWDVQQIGCAISCLPSKALGLGFSCPGLGVSVRVEGFKFTLRLKIAQKLYVLWSLGRKALKYESLEP